MKKKKAEKLTLDRETLRSLTDLEQEKLQNVNGGAFSRSCELVSTCCNH